MVFQRFFLYILSSSLSFIFFLCHSTADFISTSILSALIFNDFNLSFNTLGFEELSGTSVFTGITYFETFFSFTNDADVDENEFENLLFFSLS